MLTDLFRATTLRKFVGNSGNWADTFTQLVTTDARRLRFKPSTRARRSPGLDWLFRR